MQLTEVSKRDDGQAAVARGAVILALFVAMSVLVGFCFGAGPAYAETIAGNQQIADAGELAAESQSATAAVESDRATVGEVAKSTEKAASTEGSQSTEGTVSVEKTAASDQPLPAANEPVQVQHEQEAKQATQGDLLSKSSEASANVTASTQSVAKTTAAEVTTADADAGKTIEDGTYTISSVSDVNQVLDIVAGSTATGAQVDTYTDNLDAWQQFVITYRSFGYYTIAAKHSNGYLAVVGDERGQRIIQESTETIGDANLWAIQKIADGRFYIISKATRLRLDVQGGRAGNGVAVDVWDDADLSNAGKGQQWIFVPVGTQTVADGVYALSVLDNEEQVLDVMGASSSNGANLALYRNNNKSHQKFKVAYNGGGYYEIRAYHSLKALDVVNGGLSDGTNVVQKQYTGAKNQQWVIVPTENGYYRLINRANGLNLDVEGGHASNSVNVQTWEQTDNNQGRGQQFKFVRMVFDGYYTIASLDNKNQVLDVVAGSIKNGANVTLYQNRHTDNQIWQIYHLYGQYYKIANVNSWMALDLVAGGKANGTNVTQWSQYNTKNQAWKIEFDDSGNVTFTSAASGKLLDVQGGHAGSGVNIQTWEKTANNDGKGQKFLLTWTASQKVSYLSHLHLSEAIVNNGKGSLDPSYVCIHETASPGATAWNLHDYWKNEGDYSVHYTADWNNNVVHCVPDDRKCWQVGNGNRYVVGVELCHATNQADFNAVWTTGVEWAAWELSKYGWGVDRLISHKQAAERWGGSDHVDPDGYFAEYGRSWSQFKNDVQTKLRNWNW